MQEEKIEKVDFTELLKLGKVFENASFNSCDFQSADFSGFSFEDCAFENCNLSLVS